MLDVVEICWHNCKKGIEAIVVAAVCNDEGNHGDGGHDVLPWWQRQLGTLILGGNGCFNVLPFLSRDPGVFPWSVIDQKHPEDKPDNAKSSEEVEDRLPVYCVSQNAADGQGNDCAGLCT